MHDRLRRRASEHGGPLELPTAPAETIPLDDNSVDTVICSLVLCTVYDERAVLIRRVLRPGGTFRFVEHLAASPISPRRWLQHVVNRPGARIFEGRQLCRDTVHLVGGAGCASVRIHWHRLKRSIFIPVNSVAHSVATT